MTDHFASRAKSYAEFRPRYGADVVGVLASAAPGRQLAVDVGCGSGQLSVPLAAAFERVIATDSSAAQLAEAEPCDRVEYRCVPAEATGLADHCADLVVAAQAAHWFDWPRWLGEAARIGRPGGAVATLTYARPRFAGDDEVVRAYDDIAPYWPPGREHVDNGYRDLTMPWPPIATPALALVEQWSLDQLIGYIQSWSAVARMPDSARWLAELRDRLARSWPTGVREIRWPLAIQLARFG